MRIAWFAVMLSTLAAACSGPPVEKADRPNFILILTDDQGFGDVGVHGNPDIRTPNLDRFAAEGLEIERFYVEPVCAPTRAALMTGRYHYRTGVIHTSRGGAKMHGDEITVAEILRDAGYRTGMFGKWHLGDNYPMRPIDQGFEQALWHKGGGIGQTPDQPNDYFDPWLWDQDRQVREEGYCTDIFFDAALEFIEANQDAQFFVYLPTNAPHTPLTVAEELWKPYADAGLDETTARVYGMVENIDQNLGRLTGKLDELGIRDRTVVAFISDNGPQQQRYTAGLRGRKSMNYEGGIRALSFWQGPGIAPGKSASIAQHVDVAPTIVETAGAAAPQGWQPDGVSIRAVLAGESISGRTLFSQVHRGLEPKPFQNAAVVTDRWKLVAGPGTFSDEDWNGPDDPPLELYDLSADPGEEDDRAGENPEAVADLRGRYERWFEDVRASRNFTPGVIHLGAEGLNEQVLCRYQDSTFVGGAPTTWSAAIERAGRYRFSVRHPDEIEGLVDVEWNGDAVEVEMVGPTTAEALLPAGAGALGVWLRPNGAERYIPTDNSNWGDVTVLYLGAE